MIDGDAYEKELKWQSEYEYTTKLLKGNSGIGCFEYHQ